MYPLSFVLIALAPAFSAVDARGFMTSRLLQRSAPAVTQLSDGTSMQYGDANLAPGLKQWQSTGMSSLPSSFSHSDVMAGILTQGCSDSSANIADCYGISLTANPNQHLGESPRQRVEFRTVSSPAGSTVHYTWKQKVDTLTTATDLFHLSQVMDETYGGPVFALDAIDNSCRIVDYASVRQNCGGSCPSVPLAECTGMTLLHSLLITYGQDGSAVYNVTNAESGKQVLTYQPKGYTGGKSS